MADPGKSQSNSSQSVRSIVFLGIRHIGYALRRNGPSVHVSLANGEKMLRGRTGKGLFHGASILDVLPDQESQIKVKIQGLQPNYLLNASEEDLITSLVDEYTLDTPTLDEAGTHIDYGEHQVDVSRDPMRFISDPSKPFFVSGTRITFIVPFTGDANLFSVQPQSGMFSLVGSRAEIVDNEIHITFAGTNLNADGAKREFDNELRQIKHNLANLNASIDRHNVGLAQQIRMQIKQRKAKLLADANLAAAIGFPVKRRDGAEVTYAVPVQKRRPKIERPPTSSSLFQPEPVLAVADYDDILNIVQNMVRVMEQSPKAFEKMGEEDLRTQFLVQLNGQYEGIATGETFNFQGKTDILIRVEGRSIFIAECKFWSGEKQFLATIDQLLSYLSWRDTKTAVFIFNRNVNFTDVLAKIKESVPRHPNFKRAIANSDESNHRYIFHQPNDRNRELILTVMAFDVPGAQSRQVQ
jgi:hypothetical protein